VTTKRTLEGALKLLISAAEESASTAVPDSPESPVIRENRDLETRADELGSSYKRLTDRFVGLRGICDDWWKFSEASHSVIDRGLSKAKDVGTNINQFLAKLAELTNIAESEKEEQFLAKVQRDFEMDDQKDPLNPGLTALLDGLTNERNELSKTRDRLAERKESLLENSKPRPTSDIAPIRISFRENLALLKRSFEANKARFVFLQESRDKGLEKIKRAEGEIDRWKRDSTQWQDKYGKADGELETLKGQQIATIAFQRDQCERRHDRVVKFYEQRVEVMREDLKSLHEGK
jgi:DNA repair exonuclease SbcCD ATPase subunit